MEQKRHGEERVGGGDGREAKRQGRDPQRVCREWEKETDSVKGSGERRVAKKSG